MNPSTAIFERGFQLARFIIAAPTDSEAHATIATVVRDFLGASRVHVFVSTPRLEAAAAAPDDAEEAERIAVENAARDAIARHASREEALERGRVLPETDESVPLSIVAKVVDHDDRVEGVVVAVNPLASPFTPDQRRHLATLCQNAASGLSRRRRRSRVEAGPPIERAPEVQEIVTRVKTRRRARKKASSPSFDRIRGTSAAIAEVRALIERYADEPYPVLVTGESGTGKELVARAIHELGPRRAKPFLPTNAGGLTPSLVESELFGHAAGSFTGAQDRPGLFLAAAGGTVFLDEIGEMPLDMQQRLLRVLETKTVKRLGEERETPVDFRLIAGTNRDLPQLVKEKKFRLDLLHRLFVLDVVVPPLRERPGDAVLLAKGFVEEEALARGRTYRLSDAAIEAIQTGFWEGNVRELLNVVRRAIVRSDGVIEPAHLGELGSADDMLRRKLLAALEEHGWNKSRVAEALGCHRHTVLKDMRRLGIPEERP